MWLNPKTWQSKVVTTIILPIAMEKKIEEKENIPFFCIDFFFLKRNSILLIQFDNFNILLTRSSGLVYEFWVESG